MALFYVDPDPETGAKKEPRDAGPGSWSWPSAKTTSDLLPHFLNYNTHSLDANDARVRFHIKTTVPRQRTVHSSRVKRRLHKEDIKLMQN